MDEQEEAAGKPYDADRSELASLNLGRMCIQKRHLASLFIAVLLTITVKSNWTGHSSREQQAKNHGMYIQWDYFTHKEKQIHDFFFAEMNVMRGHWVM